MESPFANIFDGIPVSVRLTFFNGTETIRVDLPNNKTAHLKLKYRKQLVDNLRAAADKIEKGREDEKRDI